MAVSVAMLSLLSACGGPQTDDVVDSSANEQTAARPSLSAADLSNDNVASISIAQAVAAGAIDRLESGEADEPVIGAATPDAINSESSNPDSTDSESNGLEPANPLAVISTTNSTDSNISNGEASITPTENIDVSTQPADNSQQNQGNTTIQNSTVDSGSNSANSVDVVQQEASNTEPQTSPQPEPASAAENAGSDTSATNTQFTSNTTPGFNGEVLSDAIKISWTADPTARGYNVYKQAQYITTVFDTEYVDEDVYDSDYYYEIQAFDFSEELYYIATGLTVSARTLGKTDPNAPLPNADVLQDYELVFSDEFNGSQLDASKWNTSYLWGSDLIINSEEQYYVDILNKPDFGYNPFTFDGNNLTINSIKTPDGLSSKALNQPYLSGVITSYDAFKFTYGYIETRAKVTFGRGYWPAFWLLNAYYIDDKPEIDIMEFIGQDQDVVYHTYHYYDSTGALRSTKSQATPGIDYTADFHTYAAEWRPGTIIFYIDGIERHRVNDSKVSREDMYVIANTALGGWWAGSPDNTTPFPGEFTLDYIRVYQKSTPFNDDILLNDGITSVPFADDIPGSSSPSHRPSKEDWPEGYPDGL